MALTYLAVTNGVTQAVSWSGKVYTPSTGGLITGIAPADLGNPGGLQLGSGQLVVIAGTGATTDRPKTINSTALTGSFNNTYPPLMLATAFYDTTLSKTVWFVGNTNSSTGWIDQTGAAA